LDQTISTRVVAQMIRPRSGYRLLFAYDDLMDQTVIEERCPDPVFICTAPDCQPAVHHKLGWIALRTPLPDLSPPFSYSCPHRRFAVVKALDGPLEQNQAAAPVG
jgi:hypothetical protein